MNMTSDNVSELYADEVDLTKMKCTEQGHENNELLGFCTEKTCKANNRFLCLDCIFSCHQKHQIMKLKDLQEKINEKLLTSNFRSKIQKFMNKLKETEGTINSEIEVIRTNVLEIINNKANTFMSEINDRIFSSYKELSANFNLEIFKQREIKDLSQGEYNSLINFINYNFIRNEEVESNTEKRDIIEELNKIEKNIATFMNDINKQICTILNNKLTFNTQLFLPNAVKFEWCEKVYTTYSFYYTLGDNNMTALKSSNSGTITILRSREKAKLGGNYYIEYAVDYKKGGDYEVGIGSDAVGSACWIRTPGAYGLNNVGFYENGKVTRKDYKIEDGDIIAFQILLRDSNNRKGICFKNGKQIHEFPIEIEDVYFLAAIRTVGNSVSVKVCKIIY